MSLRKRERREGKGFLRWGCPEKTRLPHRTCRTMRAAGASPMRQAPVQVPVRLVHVHTFYATQRGYLT
eukprot:4332768-Pyramimonas_sp.AAC.1